MKFLDQFMAARRVSTPIIAVRTPDPASTIRSIADALLADPKNNNAPLVAWDIIRGLTALNSLGKDVVQGLCANVDPSTFINLPDSISR